MIDNGYNYLCTQTNISFFPTLRKIRYRKTILYVDGQKLTFDLNIMRYGNEKEAQLKLNYIRKLILSLEPGDDDN